MTAKFFTRKSSKIERMKSFLSASFLLFLIIADARAQIVVPIGAPTAASLSSNQTDSVKPITISEAIDLALKQASAFRGAQINEQIAAEDVRQARAAFYPRVGIAPNFIYTTPSLSRMTTAGVTNGNVTAVTSRPPSFIGANAVTEYQGWLRRRAKLTFREDCAQLCGAANY